MNLITNALTQGYSADNVMEYIFRHFPKHKKQIEKALSQGYSANRILQFLGGGRQEVNKDPSKTLFEKSRETDAKNVSQVKKNIGKGALLAGGALATGALSRALPQAVQSMLGTGQPQNNNPNPDNNPPQEQLEAIPIQPQQKTLPQTLNSSSQQPPVNQVNPIVVNSQQTMQAQGNSLQSRQIPPLPQALQKQVESMLAAGNDIENIAGTIKATQPQVAKEYEKTTNFAIADAVKQFAETNPVQPSKPEPMARISESEIEPTQAKSIEKKSVVALPNGDIGEVTDIRQGIATVNANGKTYRRKVEDLIQEPQDAAVQALELIKSFTPEQERSAHHALSLYDDTEKKATFLFHNGDGYVVEDISPEEYERLSTEVDAARTSGNSPIAMWATGGGSRGAAYQNIVKDLKKPYRKIKVGYNLFKNFQKNILAASKKKKENEKTI